jgi:hypothetical protein
MTRGECLKIEMEICVKDNYKVLVLAFYSFMCKFASK